MWIHGRHPGSSTALTVAVKLPAITHEIKISNFRDWLDASAKSPRERQEPTIAAD